MNDDLSFTAEVPLPPDDARRVMWEKFINAPGNRERLQETMRRIELEPDDPQLLTDRIERLKREVEERDRFGGE